MCHLIDLIFISLFSLIKTFRIAYIVCLASRRHGEMNYYPVRLQPIEHAPLPPPVLPPVPAYPLPVSTYQVMQPYQVVPPQMVSQQQPASNSRSGRFIEKSRLYLTCGSSYCLQQKYLRYVHYCMHNNCTVVY